MKKQVIVIFLGCLLLASSFTRTGGRLPVYANKGIVVSSSMIASEIGRDALKAGGNAIDAAVATAFALAVTWPSAGNIGGGGFMVYVPKNGEATTIDFREKAPLAASDKMYLDKDGKLIKDLNRIGVLAPGTPGTVAGLALAHQRYGKLPWKSLVDPAIRLANNGIPFSHSLFENANRRKEQWLKFPSTAKVMFKNGKEVYAYGETWKQTDLANTLKRISDHGRDGFYKGETAARLADFMKEQGGIMTQKDLDQYEAIERKPIIGTYRDYKIYTMPPPSSGGIALVEMLNMLEGYDLNEVGYKSSDYITLLSEVMKRAFADRAQFLGDPDFSNNIPVDKLISKEYAVRLRSGIKLYKASLSDSSRFGQVYDGGNNTTHFSVMDQDGNAVSLTYTLEQGFGSQMVADGLGFFLNNEMGDFNPVPGVTNSQGQIGTNANLIAPGKRMVSSMTPTVLTKDGRPVIIIGAQGGRTIINTVLQVILNIVDHKMTIAQAIEAPRMHHQWLPDQIAVEPYWLTKDTKAILSQRGYKVTELQFNIGDAMGIMLNDTSGELMGAADSRSPDGGAAGY